MFFGGGGDGGCVGGFLWCNALVLVDGDGGDEYNDFSITSINLFKYDFQIRVKLYLSDAKGDAGLIESLEGQ